MTQQIRLKRGGSSLDLTASPYSIGADFVPPATYSEDVVATGSSANEYGGGVLAGRKYADRVWSFSVKVSCSTVGDLQNSIRRISSFLRAGDVSDETLYVEFRTNASVPTPLWGQFGSPLLFECITAKISDMWNEFGVEATRPYAATITIEATIKPFAYGNKQLLMTATGGVIDDKFGRLDGLSRGMMIPEATTNICTDPVMMGSGLWTASSHGAGVNTNKEYILPGSTQSVLVDSSSSSGYYAQSLTLGSGTVHAISAIAKLPDGGTISSTQAQLYCGGTALTTTYRSLGNGFYSLSATATGTGSALNTGINVKSGYAVYLCGMQVEAKAYSTALAYGDLPGCAWSSTAHASTTTRTAASCKIGAANVVSAATGSIRIVVRFDVANTHPNYMFLCDMRDGTHTGAPCLFFNYSDDKIYLQTNTSTYTNTAALTFSAGTTYVLHATWGAGTATLYVNGAQVDSDAYTAAALGTYLFLGSDYLSGNQFNGSLSIPATYSRALTAAEVLADYTEIAAILARNDVLEGFPVFWTKSGDNVLSLDTGKQPLGVSFGIAGNAPAISEFYCSMSSQWQDVYSVVFSNLASAVTVPISNLLSDISGTAAAGDYGGEHATASLTAGTTPVTPIGVLNSIAIDNNFVRYFGDVEIQTYARMKYSTAGTGSIYTRYYNGVYIHSDANTATFGTAYRGYLSKSLSISLPSDTANTTYYSRFFVGATMGTAGTLSADYFALLPRPIAVITDSGSISAYGFLFKGHTSYSLESSANKLYTYLDYRGDEIEFVPNAYNHLQMYFCPTGTINPVTTFAGTMTGIYITPRWSLL